MIDFTLLGAAALLPLPERALTAGFLRYQGVSVLLDCGEGTQTAARRAGVNGIGVDVIALTHYHGDHIFGLPGLLQTMLSMGRTEPLWILGPEGLERELRPILTLAGPLPFEVNLREMGKGEGLSLDQLHPLWPSEATLTAIPTRHRVPSRAYVFSVRRAGRFLPEKAEALGLPKPLWGRLQKGDRVLLDGREILPEDVTGPERRGLKLVFTGDTSPCPALTFAQAGRLARDAGVRRLWLCHFSQKLKDPEDYLPAAQAYFPDALCGTDGMSISLRFES